jgi:serine carboxypeptidase-like clade 2
MIHEYLHVDPVHFEMCSDRVSDNYKVGENQSYWVYPLLIKEKLRIWVYSGDLDADVPITGTLTWLKRLREDYHLPVELPWREWWVNGVHEHEDQVGGMVWGLRGLTFASVKGAGHMVPKDQKKSSFVLVSSFLEGT